MQKSEDRKKLKPEYRSDSTLIKELKEKKAQIDEEAALRTLSDVEEVGDIVTFQQSTVRRLCKAHHIPR